MITIACCQYQIEKLPDWQSYTRKIEALVIAAKKQGASLLLMPEYAGIEAACKQFSTDEALFIALQSLLPTYIIFYRQLATTHQIYIQAGTIIEKISAKKFVNRAYLFSPNNTYGYQDKLQLTESEKSLTVLQHGDHQKIFETSLGKIGIAICYDSEFPEIVRRLTQQGASIILVPSYTISLASYHRVFLSCRARAIENQCYVATAYVINSIDLSGETDTTVGQATILGPVDTGFPDDGIIAQGKMNQPMLVVGNISLPNIDQVRKEGQVHNFADTQRCTSLGHIISIAL